VRKDLSRRLESLEERLKREPIGGRLQIDDDELDMLIRESLKRLYPDLDIDSLSDRQVSELACEIAEQWEES
jgi:hypothetical protein